MVGAESVLQRAFGFRFTGDFHFVSAVCRASDIFCLWQSKRIFGLRSCKDGGGWNTYCQKYFDNVFLIGMLTGIWRAAGTIPVIVFLCVGTYTIACFSDYGVFA